MGVTTVSDNVDNIQEGPEKGVNTKTQKKQIGKEAILLMSAVALTVLVTLNPGEATAEGLSGKDLKKGKPSPTLKLGNEAERMAEANKLAVELSNLPENTTESLIALSDRYRKDIEAGNIPADTILRFQTMVEKGEPLTRGKFLNFFENAGALAPVKSFKEITGYNIEDNMDWLPLVENLFLPYDLEKWIRKGTQRSELSQEELEAYENDLKKKELAYVNMPQKWMKEMAKWDEWAKRKTGTTFNKAIEYGYDLFVEGIKKVDPSLMSRLTARKIFIDSMAIAYGRYARENNVPVSVKDLGMQISEYYAFTNYDDIMNEFNNGDGNKKTGFLKTQIGEVKYTHMNGDILAGHPMLAWVNDTNFFVLVVDGLTRGYDDVFMLADSTRKLADTRERRRKIRAEGERIRAEGKQLDEDIAQIREDTERGDKMIKLQKDVRDSISNYQKTGELNFLKTAKKSVDELNKLKAELKLVLLRKEEGEKYKKLVAEALINIDIIVNNFYGKYGDLLI